MPLIHFTYLPALAQSKVRSKLKSHSRGPKELPGVALFLFHHFLLLPNLYTHFHISFELDITRTYSTLLQSNDTASENVKILY